jgi:hypothetical protein
VALREEWLSTALLAAASASGGWPYYVGKTSRIEPTCWALLALNGVRTDDASSWTQFAAPHLAWLKGIQRPSGLLVEQPTAPPNFAANALAACTLAHVDPTHAGVTALLNALVAAKPLVVDAPDARQDNSLQGWPWLPETVSWLEPTGWAALALKKAGNGARGAAPRIAEAEKLMVDRVCAQGGWNYGNASAVGQDLRPYVPTTAIGLIALQDRRAEPAVERSLAWLERSRVSEPTAIALSLASIALRIHAKPTDEVDARLEGDAARAERIGNVQALAMMLYALTAGRRGPEAFTI